MLDHCFDQFAYDEYSCPVAPVNDDVALAAILRELFCEVVDEVALLDGGAE